MPEKILQSLGGISETLLIPLYVRAKESQRLDAMIKDDRAVAMVNQIDCDFSKFKMQQHDEVGVIMRMNKFDSHMRNFLVQNPEAVVVHIGCGLDTRFERVDNGRVDWFDLDMPEVMVLRQKLIPVGNSRYHTLATSVFEAGWLEEVSRFSPRPCMFLAEGVFPYFEEAQVKALFLTLRDRFPESELVCDAHTPFVVRTDNLQLALSKVSARLRWGLKHGKDVESWGEGLVLLDEWFYFNDPEPRMRAYRWMGKIPLFGKSTGIFHYRLGKHQ
jgi:O-methyltransferase involved in polyketide biosynthesis